MAKKCRDVRTNCTNYVRSENFKNGKAVSVDHLCARQGDCAFVNIKSAGNPLYIKLFKRSTRPVTDGEW